MRLPWFSDQCHQTPIGLLHPETGFIGVADFLKHALQQQTILLLLFRQQRQKSPGVVVALCPGFFGKTLSILLRCW